WAADKPDRDLPFQARRYVGPGPAPVPAHPAPEQTKRQHSRNDNEPKSPGRAPPRLPSLCRSVKKAYRCPVPTRQRQIRDGRQQSEPGPAKLCRLFGACHVGVSSVYVRGLPNHWLGVFLINGPLPIESRGSRDVRIRGYSRSPLEP